MRRYPKGRAIPFIMFHAMILLFPCSLGAAFAPSGTLPGQGLMNKIMSISIKDDETEDGQKGTTVKVMGNGRIPQYATESMAAPPRIVVDLFTEAEPFQSVEVPAKSQRLERVKIGHHPKSIRLVLELKTGDMPLLRTRVTGDSLTIFLGSEERMPKPERVRVDPSRSGRHDAMNSAKMRSPGNQEHRRTEAFLSGQEENRAEQSRRGPNPEVREPVDYEFELAQPVNDDKQADTEILLDGVAAYQRGDWSAAIHHLDRLIETYPEGRYLEKAYFLSAKAYAHNYSDATLDHFNQMKIQFDNALNRFPGSRYSSVALLGIGDLFYAIRRYDEALGYYSLASKQDVGSLQAFKALLNKNNILIMKRRLKEALSVSEDLIRTYPLPPESIKARIEKSRVIYEMNHFRHSLRILHDLLAESPAIKHRFPEISLYLGLNYYQLDDTTLARKNLFRFYNSRPDDQISDLILTKIADTYREEGLIDHAVKIYLLVLERHPASEGAVISRIRVAEMEEDGKVNVKSQDPLSDKMIVKEFGLPKEVYQDVITTLLEKDEENPLIQLAQLKLAILYQKDADYQKSFDTLRDLLVRYPRTSLEAEVHQALRECLGALLNEEMEMENYVNVINIYVREERLFSVLEAPDLFLKVARASLHLDLEDLAVEMFRKADPYIMEEEKPTDLLFHLAKASFEDDHLEEAMARFDSIGDLQSNDPYALQVYRMKAQILYMQKKYEQSAEMFSSALQCNLKRCDKMTFLVEKAKALTAADLKEKALAELNNAADFKAECSLTHPKVLHELGNLYFQIGEPETALSLLTQALEIEPGEEDRIKLQLEIAGCYKALNMQEEYLALYDQILGSNDPFWSQFAKERIEEINFSREVADINNEQERGDRTQR